MNTVHMIVGTLLVVLYLVNFVMYGVNFVRGKTVKYHRIVSMGAATLLLLQYMLGFSLLGEGNEIPWIHPILALAAIIPVGIEHMFTANEPGIRRRGTIGAFATFITLVLILITYMIGETNT